MCNCLPNSISLSINSKGGSFRVRVSSQILRKIRRGEGAHPPSAAGGRRRLCFALWRRRVRQQDASRDCQEWCASQTFLTGQVCCDKSLTGEPILPSRTTTQYLARYWFAVRDGIFSSYFSTRSITLGVTGDYGWGVRVRRHLAHAGGALYGTELGSVTLKRIGFFCFAIKRYTQHTH